MAALNPAPREEKKKKGLFSRFKGSKGDKNKDKEKEEENKMFVYKTSEGYHFNRLTWTKYLTLPRYVKKEIEKEKAKNKNKEEKKKEKEKETKKEKKKKRKKASKKDEAGEGEARYGISLGCYNCGALLGYR